MPDSEFEGAIPAQVTSPTMKGCKQHHLVGVDPCRPETGVENLIHRRCSAACPPEPVFSADERDILHRVMRARRDMRHFRSDPVAPEVLHRLLEAAHHAPSVGYMQPWRFIRVTAPALRREIHALAMAEQEATAVACGERAEAVRRLKLEGILECGELLVAALTDGRERYVLGRRTLPEMDLASVACAIQNLWLAARAEGLGMGWVSIFDPAALGRLLGLPAGARTVAVLCLGHVDTFYPEPLLQTVGWDSRRALADIVFENGWGQPCKGLAP